jgi:ADP-ribose pyrophosphatase YjhB (NUDIX family)
MTRMYPKQPLAGVGVIVCRDDAVLLVRRGKAPGKGNWSLPGGAQELGETVFEAARREVLEETSVTADVLGLVDVVDSIHADSAGRIQYHYTLVDVVAEWRTGEARPLDDAAAVAWVERDRLDEHDLWSETLRVIHLAWEMRQALVGL